ncbi:hypothetical protein [Rhodococcus zopfii]|uniref:hypothetical protein n=1 Tax=Rhodococcus zopfii TaxID=43772 RepID=UPI0011110E2B|nr:hypothetical protein [Rhodococcus zopfii]
MNTFEWLTAVSEHPKTSDNELAVAAALVLGDSTHAQEVPGLHWIETNFSMGRLEHLGFLTRRVDTDTESIYELSLS